MMFVLVLHSHNLEADYIYFMFFLQVSDISLADYVGVVPAKHATFVPHTAGRYSVKRFRKAQCPIVERLTNSLMMHGRNNGKKLMAVRIIKHAMEIIHLLTDLNPIQVIVDAVINRYRKSINLFYHQMFCYLSFPLQLSSSSNIRGTISLEITLFLYPCSFGLVFSQLMMVLGASFESLTFLYV